MSSSIPVRTTVPVLLIVIAASSAWSGDWTLRLFGAVVEPKGETAVVAEPGRLQVSLASAAGAGIAVAHGVGPRWSLELAALAARPTLDLAIQASPPSVRLQEGLGLVPMSFGAYWIATPEGRVRLYLGPQLAAVRYDSLELEVGTSGVTEEVQVDTDLGVGALIGLDLPFGSSRWMLNATVRYLWTSAAPEGSSESIPVDPFIVTLGIGVRL
jgi:outer membrane protein W